MEYLRAFLEGFGLWCPDCDVAVMAGMVMFTILLAAFEELLEGY